MDVAKLSVVVPVYNEQATLPQILESVRIYEVPISYSGRTYAEGKKIQWTDGVVALWTILRFALVDDLGEAGRRRRGAGPRP